MTDETIVAAAIHPAIGIARIGNSPTEYFLGPEVVNPPVKPSGSYHDKSGALLRQGALFRIYGYNAAGEVVRELTSDEADIKWTVHVANRKSSWYEFQLALDIPEAVSAPPTKLRNANVEDRASLTIDPGPRSISGKSQPPVAFDTGEFYGTKVYLGELQTDSDGHLIFLGGRGVSASYDDTPAYTFANNDTWHDDTSDGPVTAEVQLNGTSLPVEGAWVVTAPPNYGPQQVSVRTIYDLLFDVFVQSDWLKFPAEIQFWRDIAPILQRLSNLQWVNYGFEPQFGRNAPFDFLDPTFLERLSQPSDIEAELRQQIYIQFRQFERDGSSPVPWPWLYGDAMNIPPAKTPRQNAEISPTQLKMLEMWAAGKFVEGPKDPPPPPAPQELDEAALTHCLADAFHPGCEVTWPIRHLSMFHAPYRIRHRPPNVPEPDYGPVLTPKVALSPTGPLHAQGPGDISRWMAVPWQADTASCRSGYYPQYDQYLPTFWPARVPNQVLTLADYKRVIDPGLPLTERLEAYNKRASWFRRLGGGSQVKEINVMIRDFDRQGVVEVRPGVPDNEHFPAEMQVESSAVQTVPKVSDQTGLIVVDDQQEKEAPGKIKALAAAAHVDVDAVITGKIDKINRFPDGLKSVE